jgi:hypothetical protein
MADKSGRDILAEWREFGEKYPLDYAAILLRVLSNPTHPQRDNRDIADDARELARWLREIVPAWEEGQILHLEEALALARPPRWKRTAAQRRAQYRVRAAHLVRAAISKGAKTPDVFREVYESGALPDTVSASQIEKWYYECKRVLPEAYADSQVKLPWPENT